LGTSILDLDNLADEFANQEELKFKRDNIQNTYLSVIGATNRRSSAPRLRNSLARAQSRAQSPGIGAL
jgi:hypothetical protein